MEYQNTFENTSSYLTTSPSFPSPSLELPGLPTFLVNLGVEMPLPHFPASQGCFVIRLCSLGKYLTVHLPSAAGKKSPPQGQERTCTPAGAAQGQRDRFLLFLQERCVRKAAHPRACWGSARGERSLLKMPGEQLILIQANDTSLATAE